MPCVWAKSMTSNGTHVLASWEDKQLSASSWVAARDAAAAAFSSAAIDIAAAAGVEGVADGMRGGVDRTMLVS